MQLFLFWYRLKYRYLASKRKIHSFLKQASIVASVFLVGVVGYSAFLEPSSQGFKAQLDTTNMVRDGSGESGSNNNQATNTTTTSSPICGSTPNTCQTGTVSNATEAMTEWTWECQENNSVSSCSVGKVFGKCGDSKDTCILIENGLSGLFYDVSDTDNEYRWQCGIDAIEPRDNARARDCSLAKSTETANNQEPENIQTVTSNANSNAAAESNSNNTPVNGVCGNEVDTCDAGNLANTNNNDTNTENIWSCEGLYGGTNAQCSATKPMAECGEEANTCETGTLHDEGDNDDTATEYKWKCGGSGQYNWYQQVSCSVAKDTQVGDFPNFTINGKNYDHTVEILAGSDAKYFTLTGIVEGSNEDFSKLQIVTDDITHGDWEIEGSDNEVLKYTAPEDDRLSKLRIDYFRAINTETQEAINVAIHVLPPKIVSQYITAIDDDYIANDGSIEVALGRSVPLQIVAELEDGSTAEWKNISNHLNAAVFGNPTWSDDSSGDIVTVNNGILTATKVGETTVSVVSPTRYYIIDDNNQLIEKTVQNPIVTANIRVVPAFTVNGSAVQSMNATENTLQITAQAGATIEFIIDDVVDRNGVSWVSLQDMSGFTGVKVGDNYQYTAGIRSEENDSNIIDILRVQDEFISYDIEIAVQTAEILNLELRATNGVSGFNVGDLIPLQLNYQLSGQGAQTIYFNQTDSSLNNGIPAELDELVWESSNDDVITINDGQAYVAGEGVATITVYSELDPDIRSSLTFEVDGRMAEFIPNTTKITPTFPAADALIHIETVLYHREGIENIQEVSLRFNSPYLQDAILKLDQDYWDEVYGRYGVEGENEGETDEADTETENTAREARYILDYQLPAEQALNGKTITYVITAITKEGVRTESISQAGSITVGSVQNLCTVNSRLTCLVRGLQCLKNRDTEECDQIVQLFTTTPENFSIIDVWKKYRSLR